MSIFVQLAGARGGGALGPKKVVGGWGGGAGEALAGCRALETACGPPISSSKVSGNYRHGCAYNNVSSYIYSAVHTSVQQFLTCECLVGIYGLWGAGGLGGPLVWRLYFCSGYGDIAARYKSITGFRSIKKSPPEPRSGKTSPLEKLWIEPFS
jgi:hypothetical protein